MAAIDHLILNVNEVPASVDFYVNVLGFELEGNDGPFTVIRVNEGFTLQLAPWGTEGNEHLAFALSREAFDKAFALVKEKESPTATRTTQSVRTRVLALSLELEGRLQLFICMIQIST